jgi:hypothetical protein
MPKPKKRLRTADTPIAFKDRVVFDPDYIKYDYASRARAIGRFLGFGDARLMPGMVKVDFGDVGKFYVPFTAIRSAEPYLATSR